MFKSSLIAAAAAFALFGAAATLAPTSAEAGVSVHIGVGPHWHGPRAGYHRGYRQRCYVTQRRVWVERGRYKGRRHWAAHRRGHHGHGHWAWRTVRVCR